MCKLSINKHLLSNRAVFPAALVVFPWYQRRHAHSYSTQKYSTCQRCNFLYYIFNSHLMQHTLQLYFPVCGTVHLMLQHIMTTKLIHYIKHKIWDMCWEYSRQLKIWNCYCFHNSLLLSHILDQGSCLFTFLTETLYGFCLYQCRVKYHQDGNSVVSCTNTKWGSLFLLQNSKTRSCSNCTVINNFHLCKTLMAFEKSFTVVFNTDIRLYLKVAQCQDDHKQWSS